MERKISPSTYLLVYFGLMLLLALTATAAWLPLGPGNTIIAYLVAVAKALLVLIYFMELRISSNLTRLAALGSLVWLILLFSLSLSDFLTRGHTGVPGK